MQLLQTELVQRVQCSDDLSFNACCVLRATSIMLVHHFVLRTIKQSFKHFSRAHVVSTLHARALCWHQGCFFSFDLKMFSGQGVSISIYI